MFKEIFTTKRICRAGVIAALYVALCYAFMPVAYGGILQIRPAEALCVLPLFFPEAVPALYIGCMLANLTSPMLIYDVFIGSLATLIAAMLTAIVGYLMRSRDTVVAHVAKIGIGGFFPVVANAFIIPLVIVFLCGDLSATELLGWGESTVSFAYWANCISLLITEAVWVYALGTPVYLFVLRMRKRGVNVFLDGKKKAPDVQAQPKRI